MHRPWYGKHCGNFADVGVRHYPPTVASAFPKELAELVGYAQHRPNLGNYEGQCPSILLAGEVPAYLEAVDALRPDQEEAVRDFAESRRKGR